MPEASSPSCSTTSATTRTRSRRSPRWNTPLAVAVIPSAPFAGRAVALAKRKGWDLLVHLPMEPEAGPSETEAIGARDDDDDDPRESARGARRTPGAVGINNHQGSKATADARVVRAVLGVVKEKRLFFLDSRTTNASVAGSEASALGVPFLQRDVFLDDVAAETSAKGGAPEALDAAWARAVALAGKKRRGDRDRPPAQGDAGVSGEESWLRRRARGRGSSASPSWSRSRLRLGSGHGGIFLEGE